MLLRKYFLASATESPTYAEAAKCITSVNPFEVHAKLTGVGDIAFYELKPFR
jgi:hypothetical protein